MNADGSLDTNFDGDGKVPVDFSITKVALQSDDRIVAAGTKNSDFAVTGINPNGSFYMATETVDFGSSNDQLSSLALEPGGRIILAGTRNPGSSNSDFAVARLHASGILETSFGVNGKARIDFASSNEFLASVAVQSDGKVVLAGSISPGGTFGNYDIALARLTSGGSLDTSFDGDGRVTTDVIISAADFGIQSAALSDGRILVLASHARAIGEPRYSLTRYLEDGVLDTTFGIQGRAVITLGASDLSSIAAMAVQGDGKIVLAGMRYLPETGQDFAVVRLNSDASLDSGFDADGKQAIDFGTYEDRVTSVAIQSDGRIIVAGYRSIIIDSESGLSDDEFAVARLTASGSLDTSFDGDGRATINFAPSQDRANDVAIQSDGKIVLAGFSYTDITGNDFAVARLTSSGSLDTSFDGDGRVTIDYLPGYHNEAFSVALQPTDGKIVLAGHMGNRDSGFMVARLNLNGSRDPTFDGDGIALTDIQVDEVPGRHGLAVQADGKILVSGLASQINVPVSHLSAAVVRYNANGSLDASFGSGGKVVSDFGSNETRADSVLSLPDGRILITGFSRRVETGYDVLLARLQGDNIIGTAGDDTVSVDAGPAGTLAITVNGVVEYKAPASGAFAIYGREGNDTITLNAALPAG
ncbi:MAG TPA: hypothetical protein VKH44_03550, partial [Pirellulaceae bacterium]|nr:hypothetical protein [Pirellulaceae bacterium]